MRKPKKNRKQKKARNLDALAMILHCKGGAMRDRREPRRGAKNLQREFLADVD